MQPLLSWRLLLVIFSWYDFEFFCIFTSSMCNRFETFFTKYIQGCWENFPKLRYFEHLNQAMKYFLFCYFKKIRNKNITVKLLMTIVSSRVLLDRTFLRTAIAYEFRDSTLWGQLLCWKNINGLIIRDYFVYVWIFVIYINE